MRADARRNRERVLSAAIEAFAAEGLSVPVHEIARRAGVGTGTVSRHFPTKEALYDAIILHRVEHLIGRARELAASAEPGAAFWDFFAFMVDKGALDHGLAEALAGSGYDVEAAAERTGHDVMGAMRDLLTAAQRAGEVRQDVDVADVKALITACLARMRNGSGDDGRRIMTIIRAGLRP
ncbi:putative transcriptional regulatory protein TetR [Actinomadura sp. NBRC 104412]|uniref:TetR/AcrR family transcriptional regulator n=1 Tax=Actinomadura sp. NBRC 104412 TaxID=3032203 RepID=UPI0024A4632F|nr:TetR/AcrR family transcriptional regulator [Actinomadura sp. NBRC 104412]GLZ02835.1 putative transcriptional regulatory protein TetR [Actinomadura sp. NBRC 104412]